MRDEEALKELEHQHLQSELQYLKYQINPHFFMNTLNNIHALVDMDAGKAKRTIVELSKLMRYVLYEASNRTILLSREIQFLDNYIALMKLRYTGRVRIECCMPDEVPEVQIPPLLFLFCRECLQTWSKLSGRVVYPGFYVCRGWQTCLSLFEQQSRAICGTTPRHRVGEYPQAAEAAIRTRLYFIYQRT